MIGRQTLKLLNVIFDLIVGNSVPADCKSENTGTPEKGILTKFLFVSCVAKGVVGKRKDGSTITM